ncbi:MAG: ABC transporter permease [Verrucomicrobiales bacterium]
MNSSGIIHLGTRYLRRQRGKVVLLVAALSLSIILPFGISIFVKEAESHLRSRARVTPLMLGAQGSSLELVFNGLYFSKPAIATFPIQKSKEVGDLANTIPIYAKFSADGFRIVGTSIDYFRFRNLKTDSGNFMAKLGDCVLGAEVAAELGLGVGDSIISTPEAMFDLAGVYPLKMRITGVLTRSGNADDRAVFCDVKTAWIIEGLAHGHDEVDPKDKKSVLSVDAEGNPVLNASVVQFNEITPDNVGDFHFHGDAGEFPITAAIVIPKDQKSGTILKGRYQESATESVQIADPAVVTDELFSTVFQIRNFVIAALVAVGIATFGIAILVFLLSNKLRVREFLNLRNLGADLSTIRLLVAFEALAVLVISVIVTIALLALLGAIAPGIVRSVL